MSARMRWPGLLSTIRLGREHDPSGRDVRSEFERDADRIVFSSAFRRLQDKTQVHALPEIDYVRTRLTHSLEVAAIGRSLGTLAGAFVREHESSEPAPPAEFGHCVAAACLAHDIGNPPFGHPGEDAIRAWFTGVGARYLEGLTPSQALEFTRFEGNAQGFRILTRLQHPQNDGGLQLTCATLGAFTKYPYAAAPGRRKFGYLNAEHDRFERVATRCGLLPLGDGIWCRHPLAFLMEAADDIAYHIVDLEDGYRLGFVDFGEVADRLLPIATRRGAIPLGAGYSRLPDDKARIEYLRARAINTLVDTTLDAFRVHYDELLQGRLDGDLVSRGAYAADLSAIYAFSMEHIYGASTVRSERTRGSELLHVLLARAVAIALGEIVDLPPAFASLATLAGTEATRYERLLRATDFVAGMTDGYSLSLSQSNAR
jgi:dGTPase